MKKAVHKGFYIPSTAFSVLPTFLDDTIIAHLHFPVIGFYAPTFRHFCAGEFSAELQEKFRGKAETEHPLPDATMPANDYAI